MGHKGKTQMDMVSHPAHYNIGKIEVIEFLEDQFMGRPHEWNAVKYIARAAYKGKQIEDLEKAIWYLKRKIALLTPGETPRPNDMNRLKPESNISVTGASTGKMDVVPQGTA